MLSVGLCALVAVLFFAACVWDTYRTERAWIDFRDDMEQQGYPVEKDLLFPPMPPEDQNFAQVSYFKAISENMDGLPSMEETLSSLRFFHTLPEIENMPDYSWRVGYAWTAEDVRQIILPRLSKTLEELPPVTAAGNLELFENFMPIFADLKAGLERPFSQFPTRFECGPQYEFPHLEKLSEISVLLNARAVTYLQQGRTDEALEDIVFCWNMIHKLNADRTIQSSLSGASCFLYSLQSVWQGMAVHQWSDEQLMRLELELLNFNFIRSFDHNFRFELAWIATMHEFFEKQFKAELMKPLEWCEAKLNKEMPQVRKQVGALIGKFPTGWIRMNIVNFVNDAYAMASNVYQTDTHIVSPQSYNDCLRRFKSRYLGTLNPDLVLGGRYVNAVFDEEIPRWAAQGQAFADMAFIACAFERYYLSHGRRYPASFEESLEMLPKNVTYPNDVITGKPYVLSNSSASFTLYSFAWDNRNNLAQIGMSQSGMEDWVWSAADYVTP